jgi:hypothetical protein
MLAPKGQVAGFAAVETRLAVEVSAIKQWLNFGLDFYSAKDIKLSAYGMTMCR